jgi:hypothetical protein
VNAGNNFLLTLPSPAPPTRRALRARAPGTLYLLANGSTTADAALAAVFNLTSAGELQTSSLSDGGGSAMFYSTQHDAPPQVFAAEMADSLGPITRTFFARSGVLAWVSQWFGNGTAAFYTLPDGDGGFVVWVQFSGPITAPGAETFWPVPQREFWFDRA